jgi:tellurite resistance protein TehA-like permease
MINAYDIKGERYNKIWDTIWFIVKIILIIFAVLVIILGIYAYFIKIKMPRKRRNYEIEDEFNYIPSEGKETKLIN